MFRSLTFLVLTLTLAAAGPAQLSGIYPSLAMFNDEGECGTGAVVPWADRLWVVTYAPHSPKGSSDKLYEITPDLRQIVRPESIGGTPANRMIHRESRQLFIGPHAIDEKGTVRTIPYSTMFGRPTGNARHLTDPANKIYYATMEEGLYEVDVKSLAVTELFRDEQLPGGRKAALPGYHGKGLYSGQGRLVYANNGDHAPAARTNPQTPSGVLESWDGKSPSLEVVLRNQFTEVTGPGGLFGNDQPETDPLWSMGWDHRSLILMLLDGGTWHRFRLPKGSHSYDGAHGWNTEWPRIRDIGEGDRWLATMHGTFWTFPKTFSARRTAGISPRSNYLKVIGDFCRWNDRIVLGCDDTARNEFLNTRKAKGKIAAPQSQSNLWFVEPTRLDQLGPVIGRGMLWAREALPANTPTDPYLIAGYAKRGLHLGHRGPTGATSPVVTIEVDAQGDGTWKTVRTIPLDAPHVWTDLSDLDGIWMRLSTSAPLEDAIAALHFSNPDKRPDAPDSAFDGLATAADPAPAGGIVRARAGNQRTLAFATHATAGGGTPACYELDADLVLQPTRDAALDTHTRTHAAIPRGVLATDEASVVFTEDSGKRWRLPHGDPAFRNADPFDGCRVVREVATERDLLNAHGTFYELPADNAGGFAKIRPVSTHGLRIHDFCSFRGLFVMTGTHRDAPSGNPHLIRSADGRATLWAGAIDDIWRMGKVRGTGGPWKSTAVKAGETSDPFLMTGYDRKSLQLSATSEAIITAEVDVSGNGDWMAIKTFHLKPDEFIIHHFPDAFSAYWIRFRSDRATTATATLEYR